VVLDQNFGSVSEREFFIDNLLVRIQFIIVMIRWTGLAPWEFEFSFPGSHTSIFLGGVSRTTRGEKRANFKYGIVRFVLVTGGVCHDPPVYWALVTKTPERERSRVTFMKGRVL